MTQELIANMLGVRREGVTEGALNLQKAGLIRKTAFDSCAALNLPLRPKGLQNTGLPACTVPKTT